MADISDWTDGDANNAVSDQATFDSKSCMRFDTNTLGAANYGYRYRDVGSFGNRVVAEMSIYCADIGTHTGDAFEFGARTAGVRFSVRFASDGLFINNGVAWNEVGTNIVVEAQWQKWVFDIDFTTPASATVDVYLDDEIVSADADCSLTGTFTDGEIHFLQRGTTQNDQISYVDYVRVGDSCGGFSSSSSSESASVSSSSSSESTSVSSSSESVSVSQSSSSSESTSISSSSESSESVSSSSVSTSPSSSSSESVSVSSSSESVSPSSSSSESTSQSSSSLSSESISQSSSSESSGSVSSSSESSESVSVSESSSSSSEDYAFYATVMPIEITPHSPVVFGSHQASAMSLTISTKTVIFPLYGRMGQPIITGSKPKVICEGAKSYVEVSARNVKTLMSGY